MSAAGLALNVDIDYPSREKLADLGMLDMYLRSVVRDYNRFREFCEAQDPRTRIIACIEGQTEGVGGDLKGLYDTCRRMVDDPILREHVYAVETLNEPDIWHYQPPIGDPNPNLTAIKVGKKVRKCYEILSPFYKVIAPSLASQHWRDYGRGLYAVIGDHADMAAFHFYGAKIDNFPAHYGWEELDQKIAYAREITHLPLALTEIGVKRSEVGGHDGQARYVKALFDRLLQRHPSDVAMFCYFAWKDDVGTPWEQQEHGFGIDGLPAEREVQIALGGPMPLSPLVPDRFTIYDGFRKMVQRADLTPLDSEFPLNESMASLVCEEGLAIYHHRTGRGFVIDWTEV